MTLPHSQQAVRRGLDWLTLETYHETGRLCFGAVGDDRLIALRWTYDGLRWHWRVSLDNPDRDPHATASGAALGADAELRARLDAEEAYRGLRLDAPRMSFGAAAG